MENLPAQPIMFKINQKGLCESGIGFKFAL